MPVFNFEPVLSDDKLLSVIGPANDGAVQAAPPTKPPPVGTVFAAAAVLNVFRPVR